MFKYLAVAALAGYIGYEYALQVAAGKQTADAVSAVVTGIKNNVEEFLSGFPQLDEISKQDIADKIVNVEIDAPDE